METLDVLNGRKRGLANWTLMAAVVTDLALNESC